MPIDPKRLFKVLGSELTSSDISHVLISLLVAGNLRMEEFMGGLISAFHCCCAKGEMDIHHLKKLYETCLMTYSEGADEFLRGFNIVEKEIAQEEENES